MTHNENNIKKPKMPWPTKKAMEQVYDMKLWGDNSTKFYSGDGSHHPEIVKPYIDVVISFLSAFEPPLVVCDLGCGDFNIGKELVPHTKKYIAIDIVTDLITYNKAAFQADNLEFRCLDIAEDDLPLGDCVIIRQVLQHLSNSEVKNVLHKLTQFKYIILTEHIPEGNFETNIDIISGQCTRLKKQSGLDILASPFNVKVKEEKIMATVILEHNKGLIVTTLFELF